MNSYTKHTILNNTYSDFENIWFKYPDMLSIRINVFKYFFLYFNTILNTFKISIRIRILNTLLVYFYSPKKYLFFLKMNNKSFEAKIVLYVFIICRYINCS